MLEKLLCRYCGILCDLGESNWCRTCCTRGGKVRLVEDIVFHRVASESSARTYEVRLRSDGNHWWLSCQCPAWTTGRHNAGKEIWERKCKHTDATLIERADEIGRRGILLQRGRGTVPPVIIPEKDMKISPGLTRRVLK